MQINIDSAYILILLCLPFHFNLYTDSWEQIIDDMKKGWKEENYYNNYFAKKATLYAGTISSIIFIFVFYRFQDRRMIISIIFILSAITWLIYFLINENRIYISYIIRSIQGIFLGCFQVICLPYMLNFISNSRKCFVGCLVQFSMFLGLFFLHFLFVYLSWKTVVVIFSILSLVFSALIWLIPEIQLLPKSISKIYINQKDNSRLLIIMILTMLLQQLSGIGILLGNLSNVLSKIGIDLDSHLQVCLFNFVGALAVINSAFMADILTTRYMFSLSAFGLCIGLAIYITTQQNSFDDWISSVGVFVFFLFYGLGVGPIPWYLNGSMFSETVRLEASGINAATNLFLSPLMDFLWKKWMNLSENLDLLYLHLFCVLYLYFLDCL